MADPKGGQSLISVWTVWKYKAITNTEQETLCPLTLVRVINGDGRSLLWIETAEKLGLLRLGPSLAFNIVNTEADIKEKYK